MMRYQIVNNLSTILEKSTLKPILYNSVLSAAQFIALHKLKPFSNHSDAVSKKKIIIHSVHGTYLRAIYKEGALAKAFRLHGYDAKMLFCSQRISSCCALFTIDHPSSKRDCANCIRFSKQFCSMLNIPCLTYQDFYPYHDNFEQLLRVGMTSKISYDENTIYKNVRIGLHAKTGTDRYFKGKLIHPADYHKHFISKLIDASTVVDIAEQVLLKEKPDIILTSHSCYSEFGPFSDYFKNKGVPVFTWFTGYEPNTIVFNIPEVGNNFEKYLKLDCGTDSTLMYDKNAVDSFMKKRKLGMGESKLYGFTVTQKDLKLPKHTPVYALFTNLPWDVDPSCRTLFFNSTLDWVNETIQFFINHPGSVLIIKVHPSEKLYRSRTTVYDTVKKKFPDLPTNIILLPPETTISAYDLFPHLTAGIVANSTAGLEMMLENIPVITVGEAHYRGNGFTYDPKTKKEYFSLLELEEFLKPESDRLWQYAYYYFIKSFLPFNVFYKKNFLDIGFTFKTLDELKNNGEIIHIVKCLTKNKLFQDW